MWSAIERFSHLIESLVTDKRYKIWPKPEPITAVCKERCLPCTGVRFERFELTGYSMFRKYFNHFNDYISHFAGTFMISTMQASYYCTVQYMFGFII